MAAPTRKDIAAQLGISVSTVGMILDGHGQRYSEKTRERVLATAKEVNYQPSMIGRSLRTGKSFLLGILLCDANAVLMSSFLRGVMKGLAGDEYSPVVFTSRTMEEKEEAFRRCLHRQVDGLIVNDHSTDTPRYSTAAYDEALERNIPVVEIFGHQLENAPSLNIDNAAAARIAVRHLLELGHRRIAMLTHGRYAESAGDKAGPHFDAWDRYEGYCQAMKDAGLEPLLFTYDSTLDIDTADEFVAGGESALEPILNHPDQPTAVVCYSDYEACGLLRAAGRRGMSLPDDLSVVGYGDFGLSRVIQCPLTTLRAPAFRAGEEATRMLTSLIESKPVSNGLLEPELVIRESTATIP